MIPASREEQWIGRARELPETRRIVRVRHAPCPWAVVRPLPPPLHATPETRPAISVPPASPLPLPRPRPSTRGRLRAPLPRPPPGLGPAPPCTAPPAPARPPPRPE